MTRATPSAPQTVPLGAKLFIGLVIAGAAWEAYENTRARAWVLAIATAMALLFLAIRFFPDLRQDRPATRRDYAIFAMLGAAAGTVFALVAAGRVRLDDIGSGAVISVLWVWSGQFLRAPFGATPHPPYRDLAPAPSRESSPLPDGQGSPGSPPLPYQPTT